MYYNSICLYAKQNNTEKSILWLKQSIGKVFNNWSRIKKDPDLKSIREISYVKRLSEN